MEEDVIVEEIMGSDFASMNVYFIYCNSVDVGLNRREVVWICNCCEITQHSCYY
jgi:hypothetical protein